jgi:hypothetical protein
MTAVLAGARASGRVRRLAILLTLACFVFPPAAAAQGALPAAAAGSAQQVTSPATQVAQAATKATSAVGGPPVTAPAVEAPPVEAPPVEDAPVDAPAAVEAPSVEAAPVEAPPVDAARALERVVHSTAPAPQPRTGNLVRAGRSPAASLARTTRTVDRTIGAVEREVNDTLAGVGSAARTVDRRVRGARAHAHRALAVLGGIGGSPGRVLDGVAGLGGPVERALGERAGIRGTVGSVLAGFGRLTAPSTPGATSGEGALRGGAAGSVHSWTFASATPLPGPQAPSTRAGRAALSVVATPARAALAGHGPDMGWLEAPFASRRDGSLTSAGTPPAAAGSTSHGTQGSDAPELPVGPRGGSASASSALLFAGFVALFGAVALLLAGLTRRLHIAPALLRPAPFISLPERPG